MPEVKETERKCRGLVEASDVQVDGTSIEGRGIRVGSCLEPLFWTPRGTVEEAFPSGMALCLSGYAWQR